MQIGSAKQDRSFREATERVNLWHGSVSSGKTFISALRWAAFVAHEAPAGRLMMIGQSKHTLYGNVLELLMDRDVVGPIADDVHYTPGADKGTMFGRMFEVIGATDKRAERRVRGATAGGIYVDEVTLLPDLAYWHQLMARLRREGSRLYGTTNPDRATHWCNTDVIQRADELGYREWLFTMDDNPGLPDGYVEQVKREMTGVFYKRNVLGLWVAAEGAIWDTFNDERHVLKLGQLPKMVDYVVGIDYGAHGVHAAVLLGLGEDDRLHVCSEFRWVHKDEQRTLTDVELSRRLRSWLEASAERFPGCEHPSRVLVDHEPSFLEQLHRDRWKRVRNADKSVVDGVRTVASLFGADRLRIVDTATGLLDEIPGYVWDEGTAGKPSTVDKPRKQDDHSCDALRYAVMGSRQWWRHWLAVDRPSEEDDELAAA